MDKKIKDKNGKQFDVNIDQDDEKISFLVMDGQKEVGHLVIDKTEKEDEHLSIKDAAIDLAHRGMGLWKSLMYFAKDFVEELGFKGLLSYGQFRRPASNKSWKGIKDRIERINPRSRKLDYFLEHEHYDFKHIKLFEDFK